MCTPGAKGACISTNPSISTTTRLATPQTVRSAKLYRQLQLKMRRKTVRRRVLRTGLVLSNLVILLVIAVVVLQTPQSTAKPLLANTTEGGAAANPLDQLSSANIAVTVARLSSLPETTAITNQADSQVAELATAPTSDSVVSKPQVVATALKSKANIQSYTTAPGDTVSGLAARFGVTSDSIRWSNNLTGDAIAAGTQLVIPPVTGIIYTVKPGDTPDSLAAKFRANRDKIIAYNDAEIGGLTVGSQIIIPDGTNAVVRTAAQVARTSVSASFPWGGGAPVYGYNGYDYGYCTWYVANKISVPSNWGNANTWDNLSRVSGWSVGTVPRPGAIGQTDAGGYGHVAVVDAVSEDGSMIKYSDMNGLAGFGRVGYSDWVPASKFPHYIYR